MHKAAGLTALGLMALGLLLLTAIVPEAPRARADSATVDVAIDVDTSGNGDATLGPTEACNATPLQIGETLDVDVVARGVPTGLPAGGGGILGTAFNILFDPAVIQINHVEAFDGPSLVKTAAPLATFLLLNYEGDQTDVQVTGPGTTGNVRVDMLVFGASKAGGGDGVLTRFTVQAVGSGASRIDLRDDIDRLSSASIFDAAASFYRTNDSPGTIVVGSGSCTPPTPSPFATPSPFVRPTPGPTDAIPTPAPTPALAPLVQTGIDVDVSGNSDNALGTTQDCNATMLNVGDTMDVDVIVRGIPEYRPDTGGTGISLFQFDFVFDPSVLQVNQVEVANGPSILRTGDKPIVLSQVDYAHVWGESYNHGPPGKSGDVFVSLGSNYSAASGEGVLVRLTLQAVSRGASHLDAEGMIIYDASIQNGRPYRVETSGATVAVGMECSAPTPTAHTTPTLPPHETPTGRPTLPPHETPTRTATPPLTPTVAATAIVTSSPTPTLTPRILPPTGGSPGDSTWPAAATLLAGVLVLGAAVVVARRRFG